MKIAPGFLQTGLRSHVLLAACGADETAKEDRTIMRGDFTKAFLETLRTIGADKVTYTDLIQRIPQLPEYVGYFRWRSYLLIALLSQTKPTMRRVQSDPNYFQLQSSKSGSGFLYCTQLW